MAVLRVERIIKVLKNLGLSLPEAEIYIFLARNGPKARSDILIGTKIVENQLNQDIMSLQEKGFINATEQEETVFSAIPFEQVVDNLIQTKIGEAGKLIKEKEFLLTDQDKTKEL